MKKIIDTDKKATHLLHFPKFCNRKKKLGYTYSTCISPSPQYRITKRDIRPINAGPGPCYN